MKDKRVTELVCATDAGREGELIFRLVYDKAGCTKPFKRLWISSLEDSAIREGFNPLRDRTANDSVEIFPSRSTRIARVGVLTRRAHPLLRYSGGKRDYIRHECGYRI